MNCNLWIKSAVSLIVLMLSLTVLATAQTDTVHTVQKGETLFNIAQQYDVGVQQLRQWNDIQSGELSVGQSLTVKQPATSSQEKKIHTVGAQETLFSISKKYNVSIAEIKSWNDLSSNNLSVGQKLEIHPSKAESGGQQSIVVDDETQQNSYYTVKSGDSLYRIAEAHDMSVDELKELNNLTDNTIGVGQQLTVRGQDAETPPSVETSTASSPQGKFVSYEISGGSETLQQILKKFRMDEEEFQALNSGVDDNTFESGQTLTVLAPPNKTYKNPYLNNSDMENLGKTAVLKYQESAKATSTTNGELYNPNALTAAHSNISLGSIIYIENPANKKGIYVRVNDRSTGNGLKLSSAAWEMLDFNSSSPTVTIFQKQ